MKIITISGLDGSGKTSQITLLSDHLEDKGKSVFMYHAVKFSLATKIAEIFGSSRKISGKQKKARTRAGSCSIFLRKVFLLIDVFRFKSLYKKLEKQKIDFMLSDRYFYDQIINIHFLERIKNLDLNKWWIRIALKYIQKPDKSIYLEVSPLTILSREREIEQGVSYLEEKMPLYEQLSQNKKTPHTTVDGEQSTTEVLEDIKRVLNL